MERTTTKVTARHLATSRKAYALGEMRRVTRLSGQEEADGHRQAQPDPQATTHSRIHQVCTPTIHITKFGIKSVAQIAYVPLLSSPLVSAI